MESMYFSRRSGLASELNDGFSSAFAQCVVESSFASALELADESAISFQLESAGPRLYGPRDESEFKSDVRDRFPLGTAKHAT